VPYRHRARVTRTLHRLVAALTAVAVAATFGATTAVGNPGHANSPKGHVKLAHRIKAVNAELDRLSRQNDQLDEKYNVAVAAVDAAQRTARRAQHTASDAAARYRIAHAQFVQAVTQQYESGPSMAVGELLASDAPQQYLDGLTMNSYLADQFASTVSSVQTLRADAVAAKDRADNALARRFRQLLDSLTARQQRWLANQAVAAPTTTAQFTPSRQQGPTTHAGTKRPAPLSGPVSGDVQRVIAFAEAQVGKWYSYGAAGPNSYDCSGLTMMSYAQIGIHLPHSSAEQYNYGTHVAYSQLQPGDLIFLYSPIGHVELYVGHDLAVSAANPATGIVYVHPSQDMGNYTGATRLVH